eukprot:sb/3478328/
MLIEYVLNVVNFFPARVNAEGIHPDAFCKKAYGFRIRQVYILVTRNGHELGCNTFSCEDNGVAPSSNNSMHVFRKCEPRNAAHNLGLLEHNDLFFYSLSDS